jgi:hypothetical protein
MKEQTLNYLINQVINTANYVYQYARINGLEDTQEYLNYQDQLNLLSLQYSEEAKNRYKNSFDSKI